MTDDGSHFHAYRLYVPLYGYGVDSHPDCVEELWSFHVAKSSQPLRGGIVAFASKTNRVKRTYVGHMPHHPTPVQCRHQCHQEYPAGHLHHSSR